MSVKLVHYVEFYFPDNVQPKKIFQIRDRGVKTLRILQDAFAFRFFDVQMAFENNVWMRSRRLNLSSMHFCGGQIVDVKKVINLLGDIDITREMRQQKWERTILCNDGEYRLFNRGDIVVMPKSEKNK